MKRRDALPVGAAVLASAIYAFFALVLRARGLTFWWDDWILLDRIARLGARAWLVPENQQWEPVAMALLDLEHRVLGANHTLYLVFSFVVHVANVLLLALVLRARCGDARAAALAAAAFGLTASHREVLWFVVDTTIVLCFFVTLLGFLFVEWGKESRKWLLGAALAIVAAPMCWGGGIALGPALVLEAWPARRRALALAGTWGAFAVVYLLVAGGRAGGALPRTAEECRLAGYFLVEAVGLGFVQQVPLLEVAPGPIGGFVATALWAVLVAVLAHFLEGAARTRLLLAHAYLVFLVVPIALARWQRADFVQVSPAAHSRYQYLPALVWTTALALVLARRPSRGVFFVGLALLALLALGHARRAADDERPFSPRARSGHLAWVQALERVARSARGPLFDARAPVFLALPQTRASSIVRVVAPDLRVEWTDKLTPESLEPYRSEPVFSRELPPR